MTIVEFLKARLAEDEDVATRAATAEGDAVWEGGDHSETLTGKRSGYIAAAPWGGGLYETSTHMARHDPARVLREVEAKRRIIDEHRHGPPSEDGAADDVSLGCYTCRVGRDGWMWIDGWCPTLRLLALPHADHPDYREEWRP